MVVAWAPMSLTCVAMSETWVPLHPMRTHELHGNPWKQRMVGGGGCGVHTYHIPNKRLNDVAKLAGHLVVVAPGASW